MSNLFSEEMIYVSKEPPKRTDRDKLLGALAAFTSVAVIILLLCSPAIIWAVWGWALT